MHKNGQMYWPICSWNCKTSFTVLVPLSRRVEKNEMTHRGEGNFYFRFALITNGSFGKFKRRVVRRVCRREGGGEGGGLWKFRKGVWRLVQLPFLTLGTDSTKYFNFTLPILDWLPFWALIKLLWADRNCTLNVLLARTFQNVHLLLPHPIHRVRW